MLSDLLFFGFFILILNVILLLSDKKSLEKKIKKQKSFKK